MAIDLLAVVHVVGLVVADLIATLSVAYAHAVQQRRAALVLTDAEAARIEAALKTAHPVKNTHRAYRSGWKRWLAWAAEHGVRAMPAAPKAVAAYLTDRARSGKAPATVRLDCSAIGAAHRAVDAADPTARQPVLRVIRSIGAEHDGRGRGQVQGLVWEVVDRIAALAAKGGSLAGLRDCALLRLGSDALLRVSELAALQVSDLHVRPGGGGTLTVRRSKTDREGRGRVRYLGKETMEAVQRYLQAAGVQSGALFRALHHGTVHESLGVRSIRRIITRRAAAVGIVGRISGHSLRVGAVQSLVAAGASVLDVQQVGGWTSPDMPAHYGRHLLAERGAVARLRYGVAA